MTKYGCLLIALYAGCGNSADITDSGETQDLASTSLPDLATSNIDGNLPPTPDLLTPPQPITPDDPGTTDTTTDVNTGSEQKEISRFIYGYNWYRTGTSFPNNLTFDRLGGDRMCSYNWEKNVESSGGQNDDPMYFYINDYNYYGASSNDKNPASDVFEAIDTNRARNAATMPVLPLMDYLAADASGKVTVTGNPGYSGYLSHFLVNTLDSGSKPNTTVTAPNLSDSVVKQDEFANYLHAHYNTIPDVFTDPDKRVFIGLDNEPELWQEAFAVLQRSPSNHPITMSGAEAGWVAPPGDTTIGKKVTPDEYIARVKTVTTMLRRMIPQAEIIGPSHFGWDAMTIFNDTEWTQFDDTHWFMDHFLSQIQTASAVAGVRLLDTFDFHWYPSVSVGGKRIIDIVTTANDAEFQAIVQNPRSYWDPTYKEDSYITRDHTKGPLMLLPLMQSHLDSGYPGTKLGVTEYYPGGGGDIAGGIAEADTLGIFGREQVFVAALWPYVSWDDTQMRFVHGGMKMYRDYDGKNGSFGDTSVHAVFSSVADGSAYASVDSTASDRLVLVLINKDAVAKTNGIAITHTALFGHAEVYTLTSANQSPVHQADLPVTKRNAVVYTMPAHSVTTLVFRP